MSLDDPTGQQLLAERVKLARETLVEFLCNLPPVEPLPESEWPCRIFTAGVGPGEGHARFLAHLVNRYTPHMACYLPVVEAEAVLAQKAHSNDRLVVFSQGLNPHSQVLLKAWPNKPRMLLVTAAKVEDMFSEGKDARGIFLRELIRAGVQYMQVPMPRESTVFLQVVGPMCGYLAAIHWAREAAGADITMLEPEALENALLDVTSVRKKTDWDDIVMEFSRIDEIWATGALATYGHNLALKFCKGIFRRVPQIRGIFDLADGPFQSAFKQPRPQWLFTLPDPRSQELALRARNMLSNGAVPSRIWRSPLPEPWAIFYYEQLINFIVLSIVARKKLDQENWPGKGMDGPIYEISAPSNGTRPPFGF